MPKQNTPIAALALGQPLFDFRGGTKSALLSISRVVCITELNSTEIAVTTRDGRLTVRGENLSLAVFEGRSVEIFGRVTSVELGNGN